MKNCIKTWVAGLALAVFSNATLAIEIESPKLSYEEQVRLSKIDMDFAERYFAYSEAMLDKENHSARFVGKPSFFTQTCVIGSISTSPTTGFSGTGIIQQPTCNCPVGNTKMSCLRNIRTIIATDPTDVGGYSFYGIYAEKNDDWSFMNKNGRWLPIEESGDIEYSYIREKTPSLVTLETKVDYASICRQLGTGTISFYAVYGTALPIESELSASVKKFDPTWDTFEHLYGVALHTAMSQKKLGKIAQATCGIPGIGGF